MVLYLLALIATILFVVFDISSFLLILYGLFLSERDAFSLSNYISDNTGGASYLLSVLFLFLIYLVCLRRYFKVYLRISKLVRLSLNISIVANFWIFLSYFYKTENFYTALSTALQYGLCFYFIWVIMLLNKNYIKTLMFFVFLQMFLSCLVIFYPDVFSVLDGGFYQRRIGNYAAEHSEINVSLAVEKYQIGLYGVFHNPNSLGFYSVVSICFSLYLFFSKVRFSSVTAFVFLLMGVLGWMNSLTRGPMVFLGLFLCVLFLFFMIKNKLPKYLAFIFPFCILALFIIYNYGFFDYIFPDTADVSFQGRFSGIQDGVYLIQNYPIFGVEDSVAVNFETPHILFLFFGYKYGIIAGFLIFLVVFIFHFKIFIHTFRQCLYSENRNNSILLSMLLFVVYGIALTNNFAAPFLFCAILGSCAIAYNNSKRML